MRVDVSLCGSIPRSEMQCSKSVGRLKGRGHPSTAAPSATTGKNTVTQPISILAKNTSSRQPPHVILDKKDDETKPLEPPSWAVPARGEARLEPVCDSVHTHSPVDLTTQTCIRFGRSQISDVILHHCNSSRRHAMIFHHPNGNCYVVDCGSVHGTYVNGVRVRSIASNQSKVVPHRVKKGALIRFGGQGAPTYILKSFSLGFEELVKDLTRPDIITCDGRNIVEDESMNQKSELSPDALVTLNTRINSMSRRYMNSFPATSIAMASAKLLMPKKTCTFSQQLKKRTRALSDFGSFDDLDQQAKKKMKPSSGSTTTTDSTNLEVMNTDAASPDLAIISPVPTEELIDFSHMIDRPIVSPNPLDTFEHSNDSFEEVRNNLKDFFVLPPLTLPTKKKSVKFSEEPPQLFYPPTPPPPPVTTTTTTSDEETSPCEDENLNNNNDSNVP